MKIIKWKMNICEWWRTHKKIKAIFLITWGTIVSACIITAIEIIKPILLHKWTNNYFSFSIDQIFILFIGIYITFWIDKKVRNSKMKRNHFPKTYEIINKDIPLSLSEKSLYDNTKYENKKIDKIIKSPLEYVSQTLGGNLAPKFNPNEDYLDEMFSDDIVNIVAITAENPNLWLDPTLGGFYTSNCSAASLFNQAKFHQGENLTILDFENDTIHQRFYKKKTQPIIDALKNKRNISNTFEFIRFIIYTKEHSQCLNTGVFPSLKSSQDLFGIKSFFLDKSLIKEKLTTDNSFETYQGYIKSLWSKISEMNNDEDEFFDERINIRKEDDIPEFLLLFKQNGDILIYTYVNGKPYSIGIDHNDTTFICVVKGILALLAECYEEQDNQNTNWKPTTTKKNLNTKYSYLCWDSEKTEYENWKNSGMQV